MTQLPAAVCFSGKSLSIIDRDGVPHLTAADLARALGYKDTSAVLRIYSRHTDEFTSEMSLTVKLTVKGFGCGNSEKPVRLFSPRGCHMVAMFARTSVAAAFRRWVLDVLEFMPSIRKTGSYTSNNAVSLTTVRRCGTVASKELQNSCSGGIRTRQLADFLYPYVFMSGGQQRYKTRKGKAVRRNYCAVLNLPTPTGMARQNVSRSLISAVGDVL
ncbi:BRO-N domain-containing protein [Xylella fastidiosa]|uniref:Phage antirepressor n=1 Tax=Xylella fastidiosa subsp. sandyi Ann-1 TaxID=155920 RepID=A0A060HAV0_XYLFS|nr:BRO family protein [Xylella fastidiosa]AIC10062.1 phage antirepressor [Xylella fastidiosa subsp. sandyi Ann-1]UIX82242.1 hypothetical protein LZ756_05170 [Xylella fastidiosa subsp. sandyi]